jgi:hypothetical protein
MRAAPVKSVSPLWRNGTAGILTVFFAFLQKSIKIPRSHLLTGVSTLIGFCVGERINLHAKRAPLRGLPRLFPQGAKRRGGNDAYAPLARSAFLA